MAPQVMIHEISRYKISDEPEIDRMTVTFSFDVPVQAYVVRVTGVSYDTGIMADSGSGGGMTIDTLATKTIDKVSTYTVEYLFSNSVPAGGIITAEIDYTELYQEGENRVNIYGQSLEGEWTPYQE